MKSNIRSKKRKSKPLLSEILKLFLPEQLTEDISEEDNQKYDEKDIDWNVWFAKKIINVFL